MSAGVEWSRSEQTSRGAALNERGWPILRPSDAEPCDGRNPVTDQVCVLGHHNGYHRDGGNAEWLDDE